MLWNYNNHKPWYLFYIVATMSVNPSEKERAETDKRGFVVLFAAQNMADKSITSH